MPLYIYHCEHCNQTKEVVHSMDYIGNEEALPEELKRELMCEGKFWKRVPQKPNVKIGAFGAEAKEHNFRREEYMNRQTDNHWMDGD